MSNVIHLPRPRNLRPTGSDLGYYVRVGWNDHKDLLDLMAQGERSFFGLVFDVQAESRHKELKNEALSRHFDVILDPKTQVMGTIGGHNANHAAIPWGLDRPHRTEDFDGSEGRTRANQIAEYTVLNQYTQLLGPTHLLQSANDPWLRRDINMMNYVRAALDKSDKSVMLIYPLAIPMQVFRDNQQRQHIISAISDSPMDAVWLKIEQFGSDATGAKMVAYIEAARDFHNLGVPVIADHVGGLPGLGLLAFGAVGGISHGVTMLERFDANRFRRPPKPENDRRGSMVTRVYIPQLDALLKPDKAKTLLDASPKIRGRFACKDTHCCPQGLRDMLNQPARHFVHQRGREIQTLSGVPQSLRQAQYLDEKVRRVSDDVAFAAGLANLSSDLASHFSKRQTAISKYRQVMARLAEHDKSGSVALTPARRSGADGR